MESVVHTAAKREGCIGSDPAEYGGEFRATRFEELLQRRRRKNAERINRAEGTLMMVVAPSAAPGRAQTLFL
jgi:hypothetical protein